MLPEIAPEELAAVLDSIAAETLAAADISEPPIDAALLAKRLGLTVAWDDRQTGRARIVKLPGSALNPAILVRHDPRIERQNWAVAHEIGEASADRIFAALGVNATEAPRQAREHIANSFAARLLLPRDSFGEDGAACNWDLLELKQRYATASHELIARRMLDFPSPILVAVYDQNKLMWRKSNLPTRVPKPGELELDCRRRAHGSCEMIAEDGPPRVRVWPIHEAEWRREIVRVEIDEFADC